MIVTGALRGDGTSRYYVAENFSTVAHGEIVDALKKAADSLRVRYHLGWIFTTDALFQETPGADSANSASKTFQASTW